MHIHCEVPVWAVFVTLSSCPMPVPCSKLVQGIRLLKELSCCTIVSWFPEDSYLPIQRHDYHFIWIDKQLSLTNHYWTTAIGSSVSNSTEFSEQFSQHHTCQQRWEESMWTYTHLWLPFSFFWLHGKQSVIMSLLFSLVLVHLQVVWLSPMPFSSCCCCFKRGSMKCLLHFKAFALCSTVLYICGSMWWWVLSLDLKVWWTDWFTRTCIGLSCSTYCPLLIYSLFPPRPSVDMVVDWLGNMLHPHYN